MPSSGRFAWPTPVKFEGRGRFYYEKMRYLAYVERRSIAMEIETAMIAYISNYESQHGPIRLPEPSEEEW